MGKAAAMVQKSSSKNELDKYVQILQKKVSTFNFASRSVSRKFVGGGGTQEAAVEPKPLDCKAGLVELHARLIQAQIRAGACDRRWRVLMRKCRDVEVGAVRHSTSAGSSN